MTCRDALEFLSDYLDGQLSLKQQLAFQLHLTLCRDCRSYLDSYRQTIHAAKTAMDQPDVREELPEDLVQAILAARHHDH